MKARLPKGYGPQNQAQMMKQIQKMQEDMARVQKEIEETEYDISSGGGVVNLKITGKKEVTEITLAPEIVDPEDIEMLQDLLMAAVNEAIRKVEEDSAARMEAVTGGINLPGFM
ncbi:MAG: YbaB/EbfC family nucleoid-associated protein [Oscillospiraceae bacterium]|jgi:DNA-binding YbaB/EbfC family protein|nr:YbaB/EbfC family nucleoid-associated protein [Oscillospiraceae bacterium]